jgi:hypothetical protein
MYNHSTLKSELIGLVGWRQNADPSGVQLTGLTTTSSGLYFNDIHPALTFDNLVSIAPQFDLIDDDTAAVNTAFTNWLTQKVEAGIVKAVSAWLSQKMKNRTAYNLLNDTKLFRTTGHIQDTDSNQGRVVGIEVSPRREKGIATKIRKVGLQLNTNQTLTVNLFSSTTPTPNASPLTAVYTASGGVQWFPVDWTLEPEGTYWIAYNQDDLVGLSINGLRDYNYDNRGITYYPGNKYFQSVSFSVSGDDATLWDISQNNYSLATNYGLNLELDVRCDYTDFVVDQKALFADLIGLQVGMDILRELAFNPSTRVNRNEAVMSTPQLLYEIDGDAQGSKETSLFGRFQKELSNIAFDDTQISKTCLPCRKRSARITSIGPR